MRKMCTKHSWFWLTPDRISSLRRQIDLTSRSHSNDSFDPSYRVSMYNNSLSSSIANNFLSRCELSFVSHIVMFLTIPLLLLLLCCCNDKVCACCWLSTRKRNLLWEASMWWNIPSLCGAFFSPVLVSCGVVCLLFSFTRCAFHTQWNKLTNLNDLKVVGNRNLYAKKAFQG